MDIWAQYIEPYVHTWGFLSCYYSSPIVQSWIHQCSSALKMETRLVVHVVHPQTHVSVREPVTGLDARMDIRQLLFLDLFLWSDLLRRSKFLSIRNCRHVCFPTFAFQRRLSHVFLVNTHIQTTIPATKTLTLRRTQFADVAVHVETLCSASTQVDLDSFEYLIPLMRSTRRIHWHTLRCLDWVVYRGPISLIVGQYAPFSSIRVLQLHFLQRANVLFDTSAFPNVTDLDLSGVEMLSPQVVINPLKKITLCRCTNLGALQIAQNANEVKISHCPDATSVIGLQQCHTLRMVACPITQVYCIQSLHCLKHLTMIQCPLLQHIFTFPLTSLTLGDCGIIQISFPLFVQELTMSNTALQPVIFLEHVHHLRIVNPHVLYDHLEWEWIKSRIAVTCTYKL